MNQKIRKFPVQHGKPGNAPVKPEKPGNIPAQPEKLETIPAWIEKSGNTPVECEKPENRSMQPEKPESPPVRLKNPGNTSVHSEKNGSSNKIVWLTVFGWFHKIFWLSRPNFSSVNETRLLESFSWLYHIFYWLIQMFWLNMSNNFERAFWGYNTHSELRQQIYEFVYMHFVCSHGLS